MNAGRRRVSAGLCLGLLAGTLSGALSGCGGSAEDPSMPETSGAAATSPSSVWEVASSRSVELSPGDRFDLAATLPGGVPRGGTFSVDPQGAPLPAGITLDPAGFLSADPRTTDVGAAGVIFRYSPPSA